MPSAKTTVKFGRRTLQLSNLDKVLYPGEGITKAEIIQYYLSVAPYLMHHVKYRPLSLIRYPDGIEQEAFYQKDMPSWAPEWVSYYRTGKSRKKDYVTLTEEATLAWLANLACLELHQVHFRSGQPGKPDYIVYDLDPPENYPFDELKALAFALRSFLESYDYTVLVKTSGGKGLHLVTPVLPLHSADQCFETAKQLAQRFVKTSVQSTLQLKKEARKGKVLIDIFRNRESQTIVAPYSLRGRPGAPVSFPLSWEQLDKVEHPSFYNLSSIDAMLQKEGDAWESFDVHAVPLHNHQNKRKNAGEIPGNRHKSARQLQEYEQKRDFLLTPEPVAGPQSGAGNAFVVHRHDASHLHYDLRLEKDGVLQSWALPKGLPVAPGEKRMAVQTEDHPLEYLTFEGEIPKGEYGGGLMLICATGHYTVTKEKPKGIYFRLSSKNLQGEFRMHRTRNKEWLMERVEKPNPGWLDRFIPPMLAEQVEDVPQGNRYRYELKWDGIRCQLTISDGNITLYSRNGNQINDQFPELLLAEAFRVQHGVFDGEIVCLDAGGRPDFQAVLQRLKRQGKPSARSKPAYFYAFDLLFVDGIPLTSYPLARRRMILEGSIQRSEGPIRLSEQVADGKELFEATRKLGLEGIMAKDLEKSYVSNKRTSHWLKVKVRRQTSVHVIGYTRGKGSLENNLGALHIAQYRGKKSTYRGKVGTGFQTQQRKNIYQQLEAAPHSHTPPPLSGIPNTNEAIWLKKPLEAQVQYASENIGGIFREPVFLKFIDS